VTLTPDPPEKPDLLSFAERLTDGAPVDWEEAADTAAVTALRLIERLRDGYAAEPASESPAPLLPAGHRLGRYRLEGVLGRGGMGVVYLARDLDLDREVAIKMLPARVPSGSAAALRLRQEARLLASIDHPGIAVIHAMEEEAGERFLVLERVRGVSLAQRLSAGPLPIGEAVAVTAQIAEALHAAHDSGVVHRDLKPSNVMLTPRGRVKVLDFGVAHVLAAGEEGEETRVAGTVGYMSPERLHGDAGDRRADVFAFGCVLFECLAGVPAFRGTRVEEVQAAILGAEMDASALPATTPEPLRQMIAACLAKDPAQRLAGMEPVLAVLGRAGVAPSARRASSSTPHNLPAERTRFVGRERELDDCAGRLAAGSLLTVTGPGGGGKTRFVSRLAERALDQHPQGVWFVDLTPVADPSRVALAVASALGLREQPGVPLSRTLVDHVRERRLMIVLDNCEHVLEACRTLIDELRAASAGLVVLAASREAFGLQGEQVYPLPPLTTPEADEPAEPALLLRHASVALFVDRAQLVTPDFALDASTGPAVKEICRAMDGLPLAIELAAARVRVLSVSEIAARLDRLLALLHAPSGATRRHATLRAALKWSVDALIGEERRAFRRFAVFAGGWDLAAAAALLDTDEFGALDLIDALVHRSLVVAETRETETRYRYLEPVRQFASELLASAGEMGEARTRMVRHFVALAETAGPALLGPEQSRWLDRLGLEHDNFQAALDACRDLPDADSALRIAGSLWRYWHVRGHLRVGVESVRRALAIAGAESVAGRVRAGALYAAGALVAFDMEGQKRAREHFEEALALYRAEGDDFGVARCLTGLGAVASGRREFEAGAAFLREAQAIYRALGDRRGLAVTLNNLGAAAWNQGDLEAARTSIAEALDLARDAGDLGNLAQLSVAVALIDARLGQADAARAHLRECLSTLGALGARHSSAAGALLAAAELATLERRFPDAARWLGAADSVLERLGLVFDDSDVWWKERDRCWATARGALGDETAEREYRTGRAMDREQSLERALASLGSGSEGSAGT
jgi:predicted ATPase